MKTTSNILLLIAMALLCASCATHAPETTSNRDDAGPANVGNPLNTPGDVARVPYVNSDIHWRMFASDYGHQ